MSLFWALLIALTGLALVIYFSEQLVKGVIGTSLGFNISAFLLSVIFIGFDPENLGVGAMGSYEGVNGIAIGSIIGSAMVAMALALGITALLAPLKFRKVPRRLLLVPLLAIALFSILALDHRLDFIDGCFLLGGYALMVIYMIFLGKKGITIEAGGEVAETLEKPRPPRWKAAGLMLLSLIAIVAGSEMLVNGSKVILNSFDLTDTFYGMTILAFLVSIEEIARELPAALKGKADITIGNVVGSVLAFFLFNAGIIALVNTVIINENTLKFYLPMALATVLFIIGLLAFTGKIGRWAGVLLIIAYLIFVVLGYFT